MSSNASDKKPTIGFIGLGDQGGPIAKAIGEAGYELHIWARSAGALRVLDGVPFVTHDSPAQLGAAAEIIGLCLSEDRDNAEVLTDKGLLQAMRPGGVLVNHGTGLPRAAVETAAFAAELRVTALDAPVSGGHAGAIAKELTTIVGGAEADVERCRPLFETFSKRIVHMGPAGTGQVGKLINNALLMANQENIADMLRIATEMGTDIEALVSVLRSGTGSSIALQVLGSAVRPDNAEHLSRLQVIDMDLFAAAFGDLQVGTGVVTERAYDGAHSLPYLAGTVS
jgi:3-hydroxyisobutyrate dehydrogenase-like beta-hydroxyacid dehydrogenase